MGGNKYSEPQFFDRCEDFTMKLAEWSVMVLTGADKVDQYVYQTTLIDSRNWPESTSLFWPGFLPKYIDEHSNDLWICIQSHHRILFDFGLLLLCLLGCLWPFIESIAQSLFTFNSDFNSKYLLAILMIASGGSHFISK